ncbi:FAD-dependent oxidoreductase [Methylobacterium sp. GC_Met_2]|uniref:FAD-dependent oxidoreductase n=1 Tax=Methylobacterium sp. GC_Met_2 TaxID=2937376 RepID=UPI00226BA7F2|nr:FAD-dependent oxidoreductase [Methylobacterium sp. GC_Met_2]
MTNPFTTDVLICGVGAAGLALAIDLARRDVNFRLIEKAQAPFGGSRGKGIQPRTLEIFEDLGIVDRIAAVGGRYPNQRTYRPDGTYTDEAMFIDGKPAPDEPYSAPLMVMQGRTEQVMRERLAELGHRPYYDCALTSFDQDAEGVTAKVTDAGGEHTIRARYLIGADGGRRFVRHALGTGFPGKTLGVRAVVADLRLSGLDRAMWHRFNEGDMARQLALCPLAKTDLFQLQAPISAEGEPDLSVAGLQAFITDRALEGFDIVVHNVSWASAYAMNARLADSYRTGRVFLMGDAAHIHPPTGGQGLNTSVQDAYNFGWKLAAVLAGAPGALLDTYEEERRPIAAAMLGLSTGLLEAAKRGDMRRGRIVQQLDLAYPTSSLAFEAPERHGGILAGDRAPDAPLMGVGGKAVRVFDLLKGPHWTLIGYETDRAAQAPQQGLRIHAIGARGDLIDTRGHFRDAYGLGSGDWVLVRPDGYIGAVVSAEHVADLNGYLQTVGLKAHP